MYDVGMVCGELKHAFLWRNASPQGSKLRNKEAVYIGDNPARDLTGAKNAGLPFILFRGECRDYNGLRPDRCFQNYSELQPLIKELSEKA